MTINVLKELLPDHIPGYDCDIVIEASLADTTEELISRMGFAGKELLVVCDSNTHAALGSRIIHELKAKYLMLEGTPHASMATVNLIREKQAGALIAVGSGVISDLCKYASFLDKKYYVVFPTAPSMNGYFSANASITLDGHKQTFPAHLPKGIFCDLQVLTNAPQRLILSGLGDSLCRPTAQADWLLSHLLFATHYDPLPFKLVAPYEHALFSHADKLVSGDRKVMELLIKTLIISGMGMVMAGGSQPASQGEHLIAHTMEMKHGDTLPETYHGEQIGVTTLIMAEIQQNILSKKLNLRKFPYPEKAIADYFGAKLKTSIRKAYHGKYMLYEKYDAIHQRLASEDSAIRDAIRQITLPVKYLRSVLEKAGARTTAWELGWQENDIQLATLHAKFIRDRFTFLDLV